MILYKYEVVGFKLGGSTTLIYLMVPNKMKYNTRKYNVLFVNTYAYNSKKAQ